METAHHTGEEALPLTLPARADLTAAEPLRNALQVRLAAGGPVFISGADVEQISTAVIQILLAATIEARTRSIAFRIDAPSDALATAVADLGLSRELAF